MSITIPPALEAALRTRAEAEGITVEAYLERLVNADREALAEVESLAAEGLASGEPIEIDTGYWQEKHRSLDEPLKRTKSR